MRLNIICPLFLLVICTLFSTGCATTQIACNSECQAQERRNIYVLANPELQSKHKKAILGGRVTIGMSKDDVTAALGQPKATVNTNAFWVAREQWIYERPRQSDFYYFKFGRLYSWNTTPQINQAQTP